MRPNPRSFLRHSLSLNVLQKARRSTHRHRTATTFGQFSNPEPSEHDHNFGHYDVILPEEPFIWGVSHIKLRTVPEYIRRPKYALPDVSGKVGKEEAEDKSVWKTGADRIIVKGEDEAKLRSTAGLASEVLKYAGSLVKVSEFPLNKYTFTFFC